MTAEIGVPRYFGEPSPEGGGALDITRDASKKAGRGLKKIFGEGSRTVSRIVKPAAGKVGAFVERGRSKAASITSAIRHERYKGPVSLFGVSFAKVLLAVPLTVPFAAKTFGDMVFGRAGLPVKGEDLVWWWGRLPLPNLLSIVGGVLAHVSGAKKVNFMTGEIIDVRAQQQQAKQQQGGGQQAQGH